MENELIIKHLAQIQSYLGWILIVLIIGFVLVVQALWIVGGILSVTMKIKDKE